MKNFTKKRLAIILLFAGVVFFGAHEAEARECYCSKDYIVSDGGKFDGNSVDKRAGISIGEQATAVSCYKECDARGYISYVLIDPGSAKSDPVNALKTIPGKTAPVVTPQISTAHPEDDMVPGTVTDSSGIIQCGRTGQRMCHLCDLIKGISIIIKYLMRIAIGVALLAITIGGVMYIISAGDSGMMDMAKGAIKNAVIGFVLIFAAYMIVNLTIQYMGAYSNLGMNITGWGQFDCTAAQR